MKVKFESLYRMYMLALVALLLWSVWSMAAVPPQNGESAPATQAVKDASADVAKKSVDELAYMAFWLDQIPYLSDHSAMGIPYWQYLASLIYVVIAFFGAKFVDYLVQNRLKKWADKSQNKIDDVLVGLVEAPTRLVIFVFLLQFGLSQFQWPQGLRNWGAKGFKLVVGIAVTYVLLKAVDVIIAQWRSRRDQEADRVFDEQLFPILRKSLKIFIVVVATLVTAQNMQIEVSGLLASLSVGGLALGLAAQDTVANLFGAVAVFIDKPFQVTDRIQIDNVDGMVETIGLRSTRIRSLDGYLVTIPNKTMGNATITNIARRPTIKTVMNIGLVYSTSADRMRLALKLLEEIFKAHPKTSDVIVCFDKFADCSLNILVVHWWGGIDVREYLGGLQQMNLAIKERFDKEGFDFAFPTRTIHIKHDPATLDADTAVAGVQKAA